LSVSSLLSLLQLTTSRLFHNLDQCKAGKRGISENFHGEIREANSLDQESGSECRFAPFDNDTPQRGICRQLEQEASPRPR